MRIFLGYMDDAVQIQRGKGTVKTKERKKLSWN